MEIIQHVEAPKALIQLIIEQYEPIYIIECVSETPYQFDWDSTKVSDGTHVLMVKATNNLNLANTKSILIQVKNKEEGETLSPNPS